MSSIESNLSKQALYWTKLHLPTAMTREALGKTAPTLNKLMFGDLVDIPLKQLPVALEKEVLNKWYIKYIPKSLMRRFTGVESLSSILPSRNLDSRRGLAFTSDAAKKINEFVSENFKPQLESLSTIDHQFAKSRLPIISRWKAGTAVSQTVSQAAMQEDVFEKVSTLMPSILRSPKDIEAGVIQDAQNRLHLLRPENWKELQPGSVAYKEAVKPLKQERGKLLKETKQAIQQLKLNEAEDIADFSSTLQDRMQSNGVASVQDLKQAIFESAKENPIIDANAELTKLALGSLKKGQTDTLQLLKEGGADRVQIGRELASRKLGFPLPPA